MIIENIDQMTDEEVLEQLSMNPTSDTPFAPTETGVATLTFAYGGVYQEMEIGGLGND